jgi:hypothetical protein
VIMGKVTGSSLAASAEEGAVLTVAPGQTPTPSGVATDMVQGIVPFSGTTKSFTATRQACAP